MADDNLFIEDEAPKPAPKPAAAQPAFNPFAGTEVKVDDPIAAAPPPSVKPAAAPGAKVDPFAGTQVKVNNPIAAPPPGGAAKVRAAPAVAAAPVESDGQSGPRKDLWTCPHCGAKNQPGRAECRGCNRKPDDAPAAPAWRRPPVLITLAAVIVIAILGFVLFGGTSLTLKEPAAANVTAKILTGGKPGATVDLGDGLVFTPKAGCAAVGRILAIGKSYERFARTRTVVLVFGPEAASDDEFRGLRADLDKGEVFKGSVPTRATFAIVHLLDPDAALGDLQPGAWLSFLGRHGTIPGQTWTESELGRFGWVVLGKVKTSGP